MYSVRDQEAIGRLMALFKQWDNGGKSTRCRILNNFLTYNRGKTAPELEEEFNQAGSLFLARLTTWLRLSYMFGACLKEILLSVSVFLSAAGSGQYKVEFVEVGGILTLLEILGLDKIKEEDKMEALKTLQILAQAGRRYKELICESYGVRTVAECLAKSTLEETQEQARVLLDLLAHGNPKYQNQVYKGLIALLACDSPRAQHLTLQTLRTVQGIVQSAHPAIVEPLLGVLCSLHLEVQHEALQLIRELVVSEVRPALLKGLVSLLRPSQKENGNSRPLILDDPEAPDIPDSLPAFVQQAAAAKAIRILCQESPMLSQELIQLRVVHHLLYTMGNQRHTESQRQASLAVEYLVSVFPVVEEEVRLAIGDRLFRMLMESADTLYRRLERVHIGILTSNQVTLSGVTETPEAPH